MFYAIKPVFVFDGPAPRIKKQTIAQRRKQREAYGESVKRMAEKILLSQLKLRSVQQLRKRLAEQAQVNKEKQKKQASTYDAGVGAAEADMDAELKENEVVGPRKKRRKRTASPSTPAAGSTASASASASAAAAAVVGAGPSTAIDVEVEAHADEAAHATTDGGIEWEEDDKQSVPTAPSSDADADADPDSDISEHFVLPADGAVDASVLARLPISLQYDVLQQQREHNRYHNLHKFSAVEHDPLAFSQLQMKGFLKGVQFSQKVDRLREEMNLAVAMKKGMKSGKEGEGDEDGEEYDGDAMPSTFTAASSPHSALNGSSSTAAGRDFIYYKSTNSTTTSSQPFSWRETIKQRKQEEAKMKAREAAKGKKWKGKREKEEEEKDGDDGMHDPTHCSSESRSDLPPSLLSSSALARLNADWLCHSCAAVNTGLTRLDTPAAKRTCQTCGAQRQDMDEDEEMMTSVKDESGNGRGVPHTSAALILPSFPPSRPKPARSPLPTVSDEWLPPDVRYAKQTKKHPNQRSSRSLPTPSPSPAIVEVPPLKPTFATINTEGARSMTDDEEEKEGEERKSDAEYDEPLPALESASPPKRHTSETLASRLSSAFSDRDAISCPHCTFIQPLPATICSMCDQSLIVDDGDRENGGLGMIMVGGPSALTASFQDKAKRKVAKALQQAERRQHSTTPPGKQHHADTAARAPSSVSAADASAVDLTHDDDATVTPATTKSASTLAIEFEFDTTVETEPDAVDDLFASLLTAKTIKPVIIPANDQRPQQSQPDSEERSSTPSHSVPPSSSSSSLQLLSRRPLTADYLEVSDGEEEAVAQVQRADEAAQMAEAKRLSMMEQERRRARSRGALTIQERTQPSPMPLPAVPAPSTAEMDAESEPEWEEEEEEENPPRTQIAPTSSAAADSVTCVAGRAAPVPVHDVAPMEMDDDGPMAMDMDSDDVNNHVKRETHMAPAAITRTASTPNPRADETIQVPTTTIRSSFGSDVIPVAADRNQLEDTSTSARMATPIPADAVPSSSSATPHTQLTTTPTAASRSTTANTINATTATTATAPDTAPITPSPPPSIPVSALAVTHDDDDEQMRRDKEEFSRLLGEIEELNEEELEDGDGPGTEEPVITLPAQDQTPAAVAEKDRGRDALNASTPSQPSLADARNSIADEPAPPSMTTNDRQLPHSDDSDDLVLPFGLTRKSSFQSSPKTDVASVFMEQQRLKRLQEVREQAAQDEAELRAADQTTNTHAPNDSLLIPAGVESHTTAPGTAATSGDSEVVYEAFPSHATSEQAILLAQSFDESYLESSDAAKRQAEARRGEAHVTDEMLADSKQLLRLFGLPFIEAPGEAEAQCATLESLGLVSGIITDDSDVFLFGAHEVYRHFFESKKFCEQYRMQEIITKLGLDRQKLIHLAMLLGSDYTDGVKGVGIVNATEIINAFPGEDGLQRLREWVYSAEPDMEPSLPSYPDPCTAEQRASIDAEYRLAYFKYQHRNVKRSWQLSQSFLNQEVIDAYYHPNVDPSSEELTWSQPDWDGIRTFCAERLTWSPQELEATLAPVIKAMHVAKQSALDRFFSPDDQFATIASTRLNRAVRGLTHRMALSEEEIQAEKEAKRKKEQAKERRKQKEKKKREVKAKKGKTTDENSSVSVGDVNASPHTRTVSLLDDDFELSASDEALLSSLEATHPRSKHNHAHETANTTPIVPNASSPMSSSSSSSSSAAHSHSSPSVEPTPAGATVSQSNDIDMPMSNHAHAHDRKAKHRKRKAIVAPS